MTHNTHYLEDTSTDHLYEVKYGKVTWTGRAVDAYDAERRATREYRKLTGQSPMNVNIRLLRRSK